MFSFKKQFSHDANRVLGFNEKYNNPEGEQTFVRLQEYIQQLRYEFIIKYGYGKYQFEVPQFRWQHSFYDHIIRSDQDFQNHYQYTVYNHQKHGLPNNWKYTSLNYKDMVDEMH